MSNFVGMPPHAEEASRCRSARAEEARVLKKHLFGFCFVEKTSTIKLQVLFRWPVFNFWALGRLIQLSPCRVKRRWLYRIWRPASWPFDQQAGHCNKKKCAIWRPASWPMWSFLCISLGPTHWLVKWVKLNSAEAVSAITAWTRQALPSSNGFLQRPFQVPSR